MRGAPGGWPWPPSPDCTSARTLGSPGHRGPAVGSAGPWGRAPGVRSQRGLARGRHRWCRNARTGGRCRAPRRRGSLGPGAMADRPALCYVASPGALQRIGGAARSPTPSEKARAARSREWRPGPPTRGRWSFGGQAGTLGGAPDSHGGGCGAGRALRLDARDLGSACSRKRESPAQRGGALQGVSDMPNTPGIMGYPQARCQARSRAVRSGRLKDRGVLCAGPATGGSPTGREAR